MKILKNQKGFSLVEGLLILIALSIVGFIGFYVYNASKEDFKTSDSTIQKKEPKVEVSDETSEWLEIESVNGAFSLRIPDGWKLNNDPARDFIISSLNPTDITYREGTKPAVTNDEVFYSDAPHRFSVAVHDEVDAQGTKTEFVLTNGQKGAKYYDEYQDLLNGTGLMKSATYVFEKDGKFYTVSYTILEDDPDNTEIVEKVIKTLRF